MKKTVMAAVGAGVQLATSSHGESDIVIRVLQESLRRAILRAEAAEANLLTSGAESRQQAAQMKFLVLMPHHHGYTNPHYLSYADKREARIRRRTKRRAALFAQLQSQAPSTAQTATKPVPLRRPEKSGMAVATAIPVAESEDSEDSTATESPAAEQRSTVIYSSTSSSLDNTETASISLSVSASDSDSDDSNATETQCLEGEQPSTVTHSSTGSSLDYNKTISTNDSGSSSDSASQFGTETFSDYGSDDPESESDDFALSAALHQKHSAQHSPLCKQDKRQKKKQLRKQQWEDQEATQKQRRQEAQRCQEAQRQMQLQQLTPEVPEWKLRRQVLEQERSTRRRLKQQQRQQWTSKEEERTAPVNDTAWMARASVEKCLYGFPIFVVYVYLMKLYISS